jgi:hypothetical protein
MVSCRWEIWTGKQPRGKPRGFPGRPPQARAGGFTAQAKSRREKAAILPRAYPAFSPTRHGGRNQRNRPVLPAGYSAQRPLRFIEKVLLRLRHGELISDSTAERRIKWRVRLPARPWHAPVRPQLPLSINSPLSRRRSIARTATTGLGAAMTALSPRPQGGIGGAAGL